MVLKYKVVSGIYKMVRQDMSAKSQYMQIYIRDIKGLREQPYVQKEGLLGKDVNVISRTLFI